MRVWAQKTRFDCGPVAVYNLARVLGLPGARGGYRRHEARLRRATHCTQKGGSKTRYLLRTVEREVARGGYELAKRRANWQNIINQLDRFPRGGRMWIGLLLFEGRQPTLSDEASFHVCPIWINGNRQGIWAANLQSGSDFSLLMAFANGSWWLTALAPTQEELEGFWQVVRA